jgi:beta-phosphoglucomutase-like phosphatase (HAD superfamily)
MIDAIPTAAEALIFDLDGTLVDSTPVHYTAWSQALADLGIDLDRESFQEFFGKTNATILAEMAEKIDREVDRETVSRKKDEYFVQNISMVMPNRRVVEVAEKYVGTIPLAVATNERMGIANMVLRMTGLQPHFDLLVSGDEVDHPKPAPDLFVECSFRLGIAPEKCHVFEDSVFGIDAAKAAGMSVTDVRPFL